MSPPKLYVKLENPEARLPSYGSEYAAGMDLYACEDKVVPSQGRALVDTGISISMDETSLDKYYLRIAPRSGLAVKNGLMVGAGVIDADYRGIIKVLLFNHGDDEYRVRKGDRVAQMIMERICRPDFNLVEAHEGETERGAGGFGSTG